MLQENDIRINRAIPKTALPKKRLSIGKPLTLSFKAVQFNEETSCLFFCRGEFVAKNLCSLLRQATVLQMSAMLLAFEFSVNVEKSCVIMSTFLLFAFGFGLPEMALLGGVILLLFGNRLPGVMRSLGLSVVEFKKGVKGINDDDADDQSTTKSSDTKTSEEKSSSETSS